MKKTFNRWIDDCITSINKWDDPLELLKDEAGRNITYDEFMDWLDIADEEDDLGLSSFQAVQERLIKYGHLEHAKVVQVKIDRIINQK